ncbi:MAG: alpha/beta fold hydrolase [Actinomycetota bacterium]|nr:alpha/beta fold hydrolase [Actinomycetota bacterium]
MTAHFPGSKSLVPTAAGPVSVAFDGPEDGRAVLLLAPGAGGGMDGPFLKAVASGLAEHDLQVCRFNFGYTERGRRSPDKQPVLEATYRDVAEFMRPVAGHRPLFLGGKSMGGRIASHIVADGQAAAGLIFLGYPLHPPGRPERMRDQHLRAIAVPMLFVEGTRDPFCPLETLDRALRKVEAASLVVIDDGDHSFKVRKTSGRSTEAAWQEVIDAVAAWVDTHAG